MLDLDINFKDEFESLQTYQVKNALRDVNKLLDMISSYDYNDENFIKEFKKTYTNLEYDIKTPSNLYNLFVDIFLYGNFNADSHKNELIIKDILEMKKTILKLLLFIAENREKEQEARAYRNRNRIHDDIFN